MNKLNLKLNFKYTIKFVMSSIKDEFRNRELELYKADMILVMAKKMQLNEKAPSARKIFIDHEEVEDNRSEEEIINDIEQAFKNHYMGGGE